MAMTVCGECAREGSDKAAACPHCGAKKPKAKTWLYLLLGVPAVLIAFVSVVGSKPEVQARSQDQRAIDMCWEDQGKKSHDPGTARFIAGACEKMEENYTAKHGRRP